ncbi:MAG: hypothetical protein ACK53Y_21335, partial [bacterium]
VEVKISEEKSDFKIMYMRKNQDQIYYHIIYSQDKKLIISLNKFINNQPVLQINKEDESDNRSNLTKELSSILTDIKNNAYKK